MGLFRKTTSLLTVGLVDFRSDKERTAAYTKESMRQAKKQTHLQRRMMNDQVRTNQRIKDELTSTPERPSVMLAGADKAERGAKRFESWAARKAEQSKAKTAEMKARKAQS